MAQDSQAYPLMDKKGFFVHSAIIGEMSTGKSTYLNAIFGDCLASTDIDRSTLTTQRYFESCSSDAVISSNESILDVSDRINQEEDEKFNQQVNKLKKFQKKMFLTRWVKQFLGQVPQPKFPDEIPCHEVPQSGLIPRVGEFDNTFNIVDFPGFNDPELDNQIFAKLSQDCEQFDFIFYIMDCQICLKTKAAQEYFAKVINTIKNALTNGFTKLIILFNKCDDISNKNNAKRFVQKSISEIEQKLSDEYSIPKDRYKCFCISANNLLAQRILLYQDHEFLKKHMDLMDNINAYAGHYLSGTEIKRIGRLGLKRRLRAINEAISSEKEKARMMAEEDDYDSDMNVEGHTPHTTPGGTPDVAVAEDIKQEMDGSESEGAAEEAEESEVNLDEILEFLKELRDITVLARKAEMYLNNLSIDNFQQLVEFFVCIFCLTRNGKDGKNGNGIQMNLGRIMRHKLEAMFTTLRNGNNVALLNNCLVYCLNNLQYCLPCLEDNSFDLNDFIRFLTLNKYLTSGLIQEVGKSIDMSNDSSRQYYHQVGRGFVNALVNEYKGKMGRLDICGVDELISHVFMYFKRDIEEQKRLLVSLLTYYSGVAKEEAGENCRAVDLMQYCFDMNLLRKLFVYDEYEQLCSKHVKSKDRAFGKLIKCLGDVAK